MKSSTATLLSRVSLIAADSMVIAITWRNRIHRLERDYHQGETLGSILLRDGARVHICSTLTLLTYSALLTGSLYFM